MLRAIADTHSILWYLFADPRLSAAAREVFDETFTAGHEIGISAITLAELLYLSEKGRIAPEALPRLLSEIDEVDGFLVEVPIDRHVVRAMSRVPREAVPDLPDRIIAATALHCEIPLISRDSKIRLSQVPTLW